MWQLEADSFGRCACHYLAFGKRVSQLKLNIQFGFGFIHPHDKDCDGMTMSHWAAIPKSGAPWASLQCLRVMLLLHSNKILDVAAEDLWGRNVALITAQFSHLNVLDWLHEQGLLQPYSSTSNMAQYAAAHGKTKVLTWLLEHELLEDMIAEENSGGWNLAHIASHRGHVKVLKWLNARNMLDLSKRDASGWNAATWAAKGGQVELLNWLLHLGVLKKLVEGNDLVDACMLNQEHASDEEHEKMIRRVRQIQDALQAQE